MPNGNDGIFQAAIFNFLLLISCVVSSVLFSSPILLYPQHNSIQLPGYWYELIISGSSSFILTLSIDSLTMFKYYFGQDSMVSFVVFIYLFVATVFAWSLTCCLIHLFWTVLIGFNHPMPLTLALGYLQFAVQYIAFNLLFYKRVPLTDENKKKIQSFTISRVWVICIDLQFKGLSVMFSVFPTEFQWVLAFMIPLMREFNIQILYRIMIESSNVKLNNAKDGKSCGFVGVNAFTALYVSILLGQTATPVTSILILSIDFILNIHSGLKIVNLDRSTTTLDIIGRDRYLNEREQLVYKLILIELIEVLVPLCYVVTVLVAYYGPNAEILGNIGNDYWQYESIDDIWNVVQAVLVMAAIDGCSAVIVGCMLWRVCSIHILQEARTLIGYLWPLILINIANYLNYVSLRV